MSRQCLCKCCFDCGTAATTQARDGTPVCAACSVYTVMDDGQHVCGRETRGFALCHACSTAIRWGDAVACVPDDVGNVAYGAEAYRLGDCACGSGMWRSECIGGQWETYAYPARLPTK